MPQTNIIIIMLLSHTSKALFSLRIPRFGDFSLSDPTTKYLQHKGFHTPTSIQEKIFTEMYLKHSSLHNYYIIAPTGNGKTLSYLIPMFQNLKAEETQQKVILTKPNRPRGLVVVSSSELAQQVTTTAKEMSHFSKLKVIGLNVGSNLKKETEQLEEGVDVVAGTLERIDKHKDDLHLSYLSHLVIDELDTLIDSNNGDKLKILVEAIKTRQLKMKDVGGSIPKIIFVSATFTAGIDHFFKDNFSVYERHLKFYSRQQLAAMPKTPVNYDQFALKKVIDKNNHLNLQNIQHEFIHCDSLDKHDKLLTLLKQLRVRQIKTSVMIFCNTIKSLHDLEYFLNQNKYEVVTLHGSLPRKMRFASIQRFRSRIVNVLLCSDLGSRGLDFPFVSSVINYDFPKTTSDYLHRSGRTGRAGAKGTVFSLYHHKNQDVIDQLKRSKETGKKMEIGRSAYTFMNKEDIRGRYKSG